MLVQPEAAVAYTAYGEWRCVVCASIGPQRSRLSVIIHRLGVCMGNELFLNELPD